MNISLRRVIASVAAIALSTIVGAQSITSESSHNRLPITVRVPRGMQNLVKPQYLRAAAPAIAANSAFAHGSLNISTQSFPPGSIRLGNTLPFWTFDIKGSRDGDHHQGVMVGHDPFKNPGTDRIPTYIVPLIIRTHTIATAFDPNTGQFTTKAGVTTIDPTKHDNTCLAAPNNNPIRLTQQSPIFNPAKFVFGGTHVGTTQYVDAFQRANFWNAPGFDAENYHVLLSPVITLPAIFIDVPANEGLAMADGNLFQAAFGFSFCAPMLLVDINWFDSYLNGTVLPELAESGVGPGTLPVFTVYNTGFPVADVTNIFNCCALGYHSGAGIPILDATYAVNDFDTTNFFVGPAIGLNTEVLSHEIAEWMDDPFGTNETAPWGNTGQVMGACQANLEVGDPLTGFDVTPVKMPNGFTYSLQELAFFSWFYGAPSVGVNGWFSNNDTFTTDAGPNCP
jgi:hypothetical protein